MARPVHHFGSRNAELRPGPAGDSSRVIVQGGQNAACYEADFEPYGLEHWITISCPQDYKFAGLERDSETQNDHAEFRQYPAKLGRWLTADPAGEKAVDLSDPQTWNMYAYVRNNPRPWPIRPGCT